MAIVTWVPNAGGDWDTASNWSSGALPTSADNVIISTSTLQTITHSTGNDTVASLSVGNDVFDLDGGSLTVDGAVAMASGYIQTNGSLFTSGTVSVTGTAQLLGGTLGGNAIFEATSVVTLGNYVISGNAQIINGNIVDETGSVTLSGGGGAPSLLNQAGGVFDITAGIAINNGSNPVSSFSNAGTLEMTATSNVTSHVYVDLTSTAVISAVVGSSLELDGPLNSISGAISGTGQVSFGGGTTTIASGTTISVGTLGVYNNGTNVIFDGAETIGSLNLTGGTTLTLDGNMDVSSLSDVGAADILLGAYTLTVQGSALFEQSSGSPLIAGTGELVTLGTTTLINNSGPALVLGGSVDWINSGMVIQNQSLQVGTDSGSAARVTNQAGAVFDVALGGIAISNGSAPVSEFSNAGTLEMTATGNVTSFVQTNLVSTGLITAVAGNNLEIDGLSNTISGTIAGAGQVSFGSGSTTVATKTTIAVGTLGIYGTGTNVTFAGTEALGGALSLSGTSTLTLDGNATVAGGFSEVSAAEVLLGSHTLTLQGNALFQQYNGSPSIAGTGKLVTAGTTTLTGGVPALILGGSLTWDNAGTVMDGQSVQVGTRSGVAASIVNQAHHLFDLTASGIAITSGSAPVSVFSNAGTLEMTATNNGTSYIQTDLVSTGIITTVTGSDLEIDGPANTISGTVSGSGQVSFGAGTTTIAGGTKINASNLAVYHNGTEIVIAGNESISSSVSMGWGSVLSLGGYTLTLSGPVVFYIDSQTPLISGPGTLVTQGTTTIGGGGSPALTLGSGVTWENTGLVTQTQSFQVGNSSAQSAAVMNQSGAVFDLAGRVAINNGSTPASTFSNAGTLEMTGASTTGYVYVNLASTGLISAIAGSNLELDGASNTISGTITGAGQVSFGGGTTTVAGATTISVGTLEVYNTGTILTFGGAETIGGNFTLAANSAVVTLGGNTVVDGSYAQYYGSTLSLGAYTLTLDGNALFQNGNTPTVTGTGTLVTSGTTTLVNNNALILGGSAAWDNTGTVVQDGSFQLGNGSTATTLANQAAGVFDLAGYVAINDGSTQPSIFSNAGTLEMTGANTTGYVRVDLASTGVISSIAGSNLELDGPANTIAGTITGAGQVSLAAGTTTIAGGTSISVGTLALYNAATDLTLAKNVTVSGGFNDSNATTLTLAGYTLTLAGAAVFDQYYGTPLISGPGTLVTQGATSIGGGGTGLILGSTAVWNNAGMVTDSQSIQLGNSVSGTATLNNEKGGVFDIVVNGVTISTGSTPISAFNNAGTLEMTDVGGGASLAANVSNTGTILAQGGDLALSGPVAGKGLLGMQSNGTLGFTNTVQSTETVKFLDTTGTLDITLPSASAFAAEITNFYAGDKIDLTNISNATGTFSAGVLTFTDNTSGAIVATLNFTGSPVFVFGNDGRGGTLITTTTQGKRGSREASQNPTFIGPLANETPEVERGQLSLLREASGAVLLNDWMESAERQMHLGDGTPAFGLQDRDFDTRIAVLLSHVGQGSAGTPFFWLSPFGHCL